MSLPLEGIRILALEHYVAGPIGTMFLGDFGADIVRIERPDGGDAMRNPQVRTKDGELIPHVYLIYNRNKRSLALDLKSAEGQEILRGLIRTSDAVFENLAPDALSRMGFSFDDMRAINDRIIYLTVSGFGRQDLLPGPLTRRPALDFIAQAMSGLMWGPSFGREPMWLGFAVPDLASGMMAAMGFFAALRERDRTGKAQRVDVSMYDVAVMLNDKNLSYYAATGRNPRSLSDITNQLGTFRASDGYVVVGVVNNAAWPKLCSLIGREDLGSDPNLATLSLRAERHQSVVLPAVGSWAATRTRNDIVKELLQLGIAAGPVQTPDEVLNCPHLDKRGMLLELDTYAGPVATMANPIKLGTKPHPAAPPPELGADSAEILQDLLGYSDEKIRKLRDKRVI